MMEVNEDTKVILADNLIRYLRGIDNIDDVRLYNITEFSHMRKNIEGWKQLGMIDIQNSYIDLTGHKCYSVKIPADIVEYLRFLQL
ncbi:MAG: hypothetical protein KJO69_07810 [Gammaproteobacteria bacterium]|nr:hypothetical protein [Gammaproteobacteria bacterium]